MNSDLLKRVLEIVKKTGDKFVIADEATGGDAERPQSHAERGGAYVVMDLADYENLLAGSPKKDAPAEMGSSRGELVKDLAEEQILSRINQEIRSWQEEKVKETPIAEEAAADAKSDLEEEEKYYLEPLE